MLFGLDGIEVGLLIVFLCLFGGIMTGKPGDWLMVGIHGEMYPIDRDIFEKTYDLI